MRLHRYAALLALVVLLTPAALATPPLVANGVTVLDTDDVRASLGRVIFVNERTVPGIAQLAEAQVGNPTLTLLGCRFEVVLQPNNAELSRAAPILSRKLTTGGDPPTAGFGVLKAPQPVGVTDPLSVIGCSPEQTYFVFLFRQTPVSGNLVVEALVLEYDPEGLGTFAQETFDPSIDRPSIQVRNISQAARAIYRLSLRTPEDAVRAAEQDKARQGVLLGILLKFWSGGL